MSTIYKTKIAILDLMAGMLLTCFDVSVFKLVVQTFHSIPRGGGSISNWYEYENGGCAQIIARSMPMVLLLPLTANVVDVCEV